MGVASWLEGGKKFQGAAERDNSRLHHRLGYCIIRFGIALTHYPFSHAIYVRDERHQKSTTSNSTKHFNYLCSSQCSWLFRFLKSKYATYNLSLPPPSLQACVSYSFHQTVLWPRTPPHTLTPSHSITSSVLALLSNPHIANLFSSQPIPGNGMILKYSRYPSSWGRGDIPFRGMYSRYIR